MPFTSFRQAPGSVRFCRCCSSWRGSARRLKRMPRRRYAASRTQAMIALATANRYWFVPRIGRANALALHAIRIGTAIEIVLALTAILLVSIFGMLDPNF